MLTATVVILLGVVVLLAMPLGIDFAFDNEQAGRNRVTLALFSFIKIPLPTQFGKSSDDKRMAERPKSNTERTASRRGSSRSISLMRNADFRHRLWKFIGRLFRSIRINALDVQLRMGLEDPADTGRLWGLMGPLSVMLSQVKTANVCIEPDFTNKLFFLRSYGRIRIIPLRVIATTLLFILSPYVIQTLVSRT